MIELSGCWIFIELERPSDVPKIVVLILEESRNHLGQVLLALLV